MRNRRNDGQPGLIKAAALIGLIAIIAVKTIASVVKTVVRTANDLRASQ